MSRSTQFIGLTDKCEKQVKELRREESSGWYTFGMFQEVIPLGVYYDRNRLAAVEFVQACPWSSGPMIFTGIMFSNGPSAYNWKEDESVRGQEYDPGKGLYWV